MDRLFARPIICTYLAWREAKQRGSWFLLFIVTTLFVLFMSLHGCMFPPIPASVLETEARQRAVPVQWAESPEGLAYLRTRNYGVQKMMKRETAKQEVLLRICTLTLSWQTRPGCRLASELRG